MQSCRVASRLASESLDRPLGLRERFALTMHLWLCANCARFERQIRAMRTLLRVPDDASCDADLTPEARERIRKALSRSCAMPD